MSALDRKQNSKFRIIDMVAGKSQSNEKRVDIPIAVFGYVSFPCEAVL